MFDPRRPTALLVGRWQPFHAGHKALVEAAIERVGQVCIGVREPLGDARNPYPFEEVSLRISAGLAHLQGRFIIVRLPDIHAIFFGRDVGYLVQQLRLDADVEAISATAIREGELR